MYGMPTWGDAFTPRQLVAMTTLSDLIPEARSEIERRAVQACRAIDPRPLREGGQGAKAWAEAVTVYLSPSVYPRWPTITQQLHHGTRVVKSFGTPLGGKLCK